MAKEIERKFLIDASKLNIPSEGKEIKQAYIATADNCVVRIRVQDNCAMLTLKGENKGISRSEFEYEIPVSEANEMIAELCTGSVIEKTRYLIRHEDHMWELDVFYGDNEGLVVAEIELKSEEEKFSIPTWVSKEVSGDPKYYNSSLLENPFNSWPSEK